MSKYALVSVVAYGEKAPASEQDPPHWFGFAILDTESLKFTDSSVYRVQELEDAISRKQELEDAVLLNQYWPDARDPEVLALLADQTFQVGPEEKWNTYGPMARYQKACDTIARRRVPAPTPNTH